MPHVRHAAMPVSRGLAVRRIGQVARRRYATEPASPHPPSSPPNPNAAPPSRVGAYYKNFGSPVLKCFLGALFTYQIIYYAWLKLEAVEQVHEKSLEILDLQQELKEAVYQQKQRAGDTVNRAVGAVGEAKDKMVDGAIEAKEEAAKATGAVGKVAKGGWWPW